MQAGRKKDASIFYLREKAILEEIIINYFLTVIEKGKGAYYKMNTFVMQITGNKTCIQLRSKNNKQVTGNQGWFEIQQGRTGDSMTPGKRLRDQPSSDTSLGNA